MAMGPDDIIEVTDDTASIDQTPSPSSCSIEAPVLRTEEEGLEYYLLCLIGVEAAGPGNGPVLRANGIECLKARRSRMPLGGGSFMIVMKNPEPARQMGPMSARAQIAAGSDDWPACLGLMAQATGVGNRILFSFIAS